MGRTRFGKACVHAFITGHIYFAEDTADFGCNGHALFGLQIENGDLYALGSKLTRRGFAKAGSPAGNDGSNCGIEFHSKSFLKTISGHGDVEIYTRSMIVTLAWPPPSHMVCKPYLPLRASSAFSSVAINLVPEAPNG